MAKRKTITETIRDAVESSPETYYRISKGADVPLPTMYGLKSRPDFKMSMETAEKLAAYFDLELVPRKKPSRK